MEESSTLVAQNSDHLAASSPSSLSFVSEQDASFRGEELINKMSRAVLLALALAVILATAAGSGVGEKANDASSDGPRLGGDFAAFYAAGSIVWDGDIDDLYDPARQEAAQQDLGLDGYLAFAYPPHVAIAYAPLGALSFQTAYFAHTLAMAVAFLAAVQLLAPIVPLLARWRWPILAASFTFLPLITAIGGGQNAALSVLLLAAIWRLLHDDRELLAGLAVGLLIFRPQYAIPMLGLLVLAKHGRAVGSAVVTIACTWAVTAAIRGANWLPAWWEQVGPFVERDAEVNAANSISALGFLQAAWSADSVGAEALGVALAGLVVLALMYLWLYPARFSLAQRMGAAAIGIILISPHTMFYDASLVLVAGAALLAESQAMPVRLVGGVWALALSHLVADALGATPLAIVVGAVFIAWTWRLTHPTNTNPTGTDSTRSGAQPAVKELTHA